MEVQNEVIDWYIKLYNNNITSPHTNIAFNDTDRAFIQSKFKLDKERRELISDFRKFVDNYEFNYFDQCY